MMLNYKKSNGKSWVKLLALLPILGSFLVLNAETVTDYVYQQPQKKMVKKGRKAGKVNVSGKTIEVVKADTAVAASPVNVNVIYEKKDKLDNPLIIIDGKRASTEEMKALDPKTIDHVDVLKDKASTEVYGEEGKNGVILITTKNATSLDQVQADAPAFTGQATSDEEPQKVKVVETVYPEVFDVVEKAPEFPGGVEALMKFLSENVRYPEAAHKIGAQGRVLVSFIVEPDGGISNAHVLKKVNDDLDAEAVRVIGSMPKWTPGMQSGKAVRVKYTVPITFRLN